MILNCLEFLITIIKILVDIILELKLKVVSRFKNFLKNNPIDTFIIDTAIISNLDSNLIFNYASKYSIDLLEVPSLKKYY